VRPGQRPGPAHTHTGELVGEPAVLVRGGPAQRRHRTGRDAGGADPREGVGGDTGPRQRTVDERHPRPRAGRRGRRSRPRRSRRPRRRRAAHRSRRGSSPCTSRYSSSARSSCAGAYAGRGSSTPSRAAESSSRRAARSQRAARAPNAGGDLVRSGGRDPGVASAGSGSGSDGLSSRCTRSLSSTVYGRPRRSSAVAATPCAAQQPGEPLPRVLLAVVLVRQHRREHVRADALLGEATERGARSVRGPDTEKPRSPACSTSGARRRAAPTRARRR
jgi:hypothetical protein